jgi:hypothetical protein
MNHPLAAASLSPAQIQQFVTEGFVRIDNAFPSTLADACREKLWLRAGLAPDAPPSAWTKPVIRIGEIPHPLFRDAASTPTLVAAYDALVGPGRWLPRGSLGTFPIRFPSPDDPGDCGWHIDVSFGTENEPDFMKWRANVKSKGRLLLMLFLFSDVSENDAPTRIRMGSHMDIARRLAPHGDEGLTLGELASTNFAESAYRPEALATGPAGTVYLCHPFLVHSGQPHRGKTPRFMAQPPLLPTDRGSDPLDPASPVARAIELAFS